MKLENLRIGNGIDFHKFDSEKGNHFIMLGGIKVPHFYKIIAHSDGDVILHSLCDAIFGALSNGNIGVHFPPRDEKWKNASSGIFLNYAFELLKKRKGKFINADITVVAEAPKVMPHVIKMKENIANAIETLPENIGIKAVTSEGMGFLGRGEGIGAYANVLVLL
jgi:2-C-methyl-D-erythritol 2,4-cyclodiphosphate synthase